MSRKANKAVIGAFVVGAIALLVIAILVFGSGAIFKQRNKFVLFFDGSIKGLSEGAPVIFRGVKIGTVKNISLVYDPRIDDLVIPVIIEIEEGIIKGAPRKLVVRDYKDLINLGLKARLEIQSFITGQLMISFDFYPNKPLRLRGIMKQYQELPTLPISPDIFEVMEEIPIKEIAKNLEETVAQINKLVQSEGFYGLGNTLKELNQSARSLRFFTEYLEQHPEAFLKGKPNRKGD
jgi:paraquat-inducible protein B